MKDTFLTLAVGEIPNPIFESPAKRFLVSELGGDLPVSDFSSTITGDGVIIGHPAVDSVINNLIIYYRLFAMWAFNLVFHFSSSFSWQVRFSLTLDWINHKDSSLVFMVKKIASIPS